MSTRLQVAFITGQSDPSSCALSPAQERFLGALPVPDHGKVRCNFPYAAESPPHHPVSLPRASWHNAHQYLASRYLVFAERHRASVLRMITHADQTILLAGSCGLELLANLRLPELMLRRLHVFAYGAVVRRRPPVDIVAVHGRRDWIARHWREHGDVLVDCHHMNYLESPDVLARCTEFIARVRARA